jgi:hypothetical protein
VRNKKIRQKKKKGFVILIIEGILINNTVKPVYKGHSREPENVAFISRCPLYIQVKIIDTIHQWEI